jgi:hypothetical protein
MTNFIVHVKSEAVSDIVNWLKYPDFKASLSLINSVKFIAPAQDAGQYVAMIVDYDSYVILEDLIAPGGIRDKNTIDSKYVLSEYLKRIGTNPLSVYTQDAQAVDEVLQFCIKIIEEKYVVTEIF